MASAYTPGLTVSGDIVVRRTRRLPIKGAVLVKVGDQVSPSDVLAQAKLPGILQTIKLAERLGVEAKDAPGACLVAIGSRVEVGQLIGETKGLFGRFFRSTVTSDYIGTIDSISDVSGNVLVREDPTPIDVTAYIEGTIVDVLPQEGAIVEARGAMVQGIFGVGGERVGTVRVAVQDHHAILKPEDIQPSDQGKILVAGAGITYEAIQRASEVGVNGLISGGIKDSDLTQFLGYDIGVAITGQEAINLTIVVTEGFGFLAMAQRTFDLLKSLEGQQSSINGATQIRAGVIRPELIVPMTGHLGDVKVAQQVFELKLGTPVRIIREPYFGEIGSVTELPAQLVVLESGTEVRVLKAKLGDGQEVTIPRANVEILA